MGLSTELDLADLLGLIGDDIKIRVSPDGKHIILFDENRFSSAFYRLESKGTRQLTHSLLKLEEVKGNYHFTTLTEVRAIGRDTFDLGEF
jgi:hypothetical protein